MPHTDRHSHNERKVILVAPLAFPAMVRIQTAHGLMAITLYMVVSHTAYASGVLLNLD